MSAKYQRIKQADLSLPAPLRWLTRAFSSITLAVVLLVFVMLYGVVASVPVFFLALAGLYLVVGAPTLGLAGGLSYAMIRRTALSPLAKAGLTALLLAAGGVACWQGCLWIYDWAWHQPFFIENRGTVMYRLPFFEMTELEFYSWWPMQLVLILFVVNMIWATIRRIEFKFVNLGVLTVHTGIVTLALGAILYGQLKVEGNTILFRPDLGGGFVRHFFDATTPAIYITHDGQQLMVPLDELPRYNDYSPEELHIPLHEAPHFGEVVGGDVEISIAGFFAYGELEPKWVDAASIPDRGQEPALGPALQVRFGDADGPRSPNTFTLVSGVPAQRVVETPAFAVELLDDPDPQRLKDLQAGFNGPHGLVVAIPGSDYRETFAITPGQVIEAGQTGWTLTIDEVGPYGLPFVTEGYQGASDTRAVVEVTGPDGQQFRRIVMHRYPERSQDFVPAPDDPGVGPMGKRRDPDPAIRLTYLDATKQQVHLIPSGEDGLAMIFRVPGIKPMVANLREAKFPLSTGEGMTWLHVVGRMNDAVQITEPTPTPQARRDPKDEGTYLHAILPVEIRATVDGQPWRDVVYLRHMQFPHLPDEQVRPAEVEIPGVGTVELAFSRERHALPFAIALKHFEMQPYAGSQIPRDFVAQLLIADVDDNGMMSEQPTEYTARLNNPVNYAASGGPLNLRRAKISQIGWDPGTQGDPNLERLNAAGLFTNQQRYTVLGIGNNVGIWIIWTGAIMVALGIPWAFYVKPWLVRRKSAKLREQHARPKSAEAEAETEDDKELVAA